jgi:hypothetical protein
MNGDISVDIEPIYRTTGHKSAAFVGVYAVRIFDIKHFLHFQW